MRKSIIQLQNQRGFVEPSLSLTIVMASLLAFAIGNSKMVRFCGNLSAKTKAIEVGEKALEGFLNLPWDDGLLREGVHPMLGDTISPALSTLRWTVEAVSTPDETRLKRLKITSFVVEGSGLTSHGPEITGYKYDDF